MGYRSDIVLASASPRRKEMFEEKGIPVRICPADVDETLPMDMSPEVSVMYLALKKAKRVSEILEEEANACERHVEEARVCEGHGEEIPGSEASDDGRSGGLIIAADTIVVFDGEVIGKPVDEEEAYRVLSAMRGNRHVVITGVCVIDGGSLNLRSSGVRPTPIRCLYETTDVYFKNYSEEELRAYVQTDEPYDKAGGYAIQETFGRYIDHIDGDRDNVIGFPMYRVEQLLLENVPHI